MAFMRFQQWLNETLSAGKKTRRVDNVKAKKERRRFQPALETLEDRTVPSTILWTNKGDANNDRDGFNSVFGSNAAVARNVVDYALLSWQSVISSFNYSDASLRDTYEMTVNMAASGVSLGASANATNNNNGKPTTGAATIGRGNDADKDGNGHGGGWFLDPTPQEHSEFMGTINNAFSAKAPTLNPNGTPNPIASQADLYSVVLHEFGHALGLSGNNNNLLLKSGGLATMTKAGGKPVTDTDPNSNNSPKGQPTTNPGFLWRFDGPSIRHLLTSYNSADANGQTLGTDSGGPVHSAAASQIVTDNGITYVGADDLMNPRYGLGERRLIPETMALILKDAYGYTINHPADWPIGVPANSGVGAYGTSFYAMLRRSDGQLLIRGGAGDDVITVSTIGSGLLVSVDIGNDVAGTGSLPGAGNLPAFSAFFPTLSAINSIVIQAGDGNDTIKIGTGSINLMPRVSVDGGTGTDRLYVDDRLVFNTYTYTVTNSTVVRNNGFGGLSYANVESLTLFTEAKTASPVTTVNVESTAAATPVTIAGSGNSTINVGKDGNVFSSILGDLTISPTGKAALNVDASLDIGTTIAISNTSILGLARASIFYDPNRLSGLTVSAGSGFRGNTITVRSTPTAPVTLNTGDDIDVVTILSTSGPLTVNGQAGTDTVSIGNNGSVRSINGQLTVTNAGSFSAVVVDDSADKVSRTAIVYNNGVSRGSYTVISGLIQGGDILLKGRDLSSLTIRAGSGGNTFRIHDTPSNFRGGGLSTGIVTGDGNDQVTVDGTTGALVLNVQKGNNLINIGSGNASLDAIQGPITLTGSRGNNAVHIDDRLTKASRSLTHTITALSYTRTGAAPIYYLDQVSSFELLAGSAADTINVQGRPATSKGIADFTIDGGPGNDIFNIGNAANQIADIGTVILNGKGGADVLNLLDQGTTTPARYALRPSQLSSNGAFLLYGTFEKLSLYGGSGGNTVTITGTNLSASPGGSLTTVHTGIGDDVVTVGTSLDGIKSPLSIDGQDGNDRLILNDSTAKTGQAYVVLPGAVNRTNAASILFDAVEHLDVTGTPFDDSFQVGDATHSLDGLQPIITLNGQGGVNTLDYSAYPASVSQSIPGLVSWYKGEGNANDAVGGNNGTLVNGAAFAPGKVGQAFSFDGVDDYVDLGNPASLDIPGSLTVEAWVNYETLSQYKYLVADFNAGGHVSQGSLGILQDGRFFWYQSMTDGSFIQVEGATTAVAGQWYHVGVVRDDVAKTVTLYVNGVEDARSSYAGTAVGLQQTKFLGGATPVGFPGDFFNGRIDEPSIYNRALRAAEIQGIFAAGSAGKPTGNNTGVLVNLLLGQATGIEGGIANFRNAIGSAGNDNLTGSVLGGVLMGGAGSDVLTASGGRNILVGGSGVDTLNGGNGGDILIGGRLSYYDEAAHTVNTLALNRLLAEWSRTNLSYQDRVNHLNGSVVTRARNFPYFLNSLTVFDDGDVDTIFVGLGENWLLDS